MSTSLRPETRALKITRQIEILESNLQFECRQAIRFLERAAMHDENISKHRALERQLTPDEQHAWQQAESAAPNARMAAFD